MWVDETAKNCYILRVRVEQMTALIHVGEESPDTVPGGNIRIMESR